MEIPTILKQKSSEERMVKFYILIVFLVLGLLISAASMIPAKLRDTASEGREDGAQPRGHWPHLLGHPAIEVENKIKDERPDLHVVRVPHNSMVTMDMRMDRVRVFVGDDGTVVRPPRVG